MATSFFFVFLIIPRLQSYFASPQEHSWKINVIFFIIFHFISSSVEMHFQAGISFCFSIELEAAKLLKWSFICKCKKRESLWCIFLEKSSLWTEHLVFFLIKNGRKYYSLPKDTKRLGNKALQTATLLMLSFVIFSRHALLAHFVCVHRLLWT